MSLSYEDFHYIRTLVQQRSAIVLEAEKAYLAETRLVPLVRREGVGSLTALVARLLVKYFQKQGADWQLKDEVRRAVEFSVVNLIEAWPPLPQLDVVLLRNVLIYFDVATKKQILGRIRRLLRPDGYLFLGGAETTLNLDDAFERLPFDRAGCYRLRRG